ncbi:MAG TPA: pitrilysin family protein [Gammaproteobacteria bacterium]|nr:pitrilysin family protein [Gammaproteobacteria bacterium]
MSAIKRFVLVLLLAAAGAVQATPDIQHWQTANGAEVYFVPSDSLPMVDLRVVFDAGAARDGERPGRAMLTNGLLAEGAGGLSADAIAARFESLGARFSNSSHRDMAVVSLRSLTAEDLLDPAVTLMAQVLAAPDFPDKAFAREQRRMLAALKKRKESPGKIASRAFYQSVYGDHPYAGLPIGTEEGVKTLTPEALRAFHERYYVGENAVVAIVGDVERAQAEDLANRVIGGLPAGEHAPPLPEAPAAKAETLHRDHPSSQTHILLGQPGMRRGDPDYFPLYVGNHILGGSGLVSRISEQVREKRGLAYSAYSYFAPMRAEGPFVVGAQTKNASAEEALEVLRETVGRFVEAGPSAEELEAAKKNITGGFALQVDSNSDIVGYLGMIGFYGLPLDYLDRFIERVRAIDREQVHDAFRRRVHPERMVTVTVGGS